MVTDPKLGAFGLADMLENKVPLAFDKDSAR